ncbi:MAG: DNA methylase [Clostridiales bacterium]|nr:DNA methylase [Clostridiales bacterium]
MERACIAIDLKSFYASVECVQRGLDPMTAYLVVADPSRTDKTICLAVSPSLKAYGIPGRVRLFEVRQKLRDIKAQTGRTIPLIIAPPQMAKYMKVSADIYSIYLQYVAPEDIHVYSIDEVFMDVTDYLKTYHVSVHELARRMIREVLKRTGITATAGIGTNLYLAKIAMDIMAKHVEADKDGVRIAELNEKSFRERLWDYRPLTAFWRIGHGTASKLEKNGMLTMGDIARRSLMDEESLYRLFGIDAEILIDHAWGIEKCGMADIKAFRPKRSSTGSAQVLPFPYDVCQARLIVQEMTDQLALDLVEKHQLCDRATLTLQYDRENVDLGVYQGSIHQDWYGRKVPPAAHGTAHFTTMTNSSEQMIEGMLQVYDAIMDPSLTVRMISVTADHVQKEADASVQMDMFSDPGKMEKERRLQETMLELKSKYGKNAVLKGMNLKKDARERERNEQVGGHKA